MTALPSPHPSLTSPSTSSSSSPAAAAAASWSSSWSSWSSRVRVGVGVATGVVAALLLFAELPGWGAGAGAGGGAAAGDTCDFDARRSGVLERVEVGWRGPVEFAADVRRGGGEPRSCFCECAGRGRLRCTECTVPTAVVPQVEAMVQRGSAREPRVLCWSPVKEPGGLPVDEIRHTWGRHCDRLVFTSKEGDAEKGVAALESVVHSRSLWNIVHPGWAHVAATYADDYDWFIKLDDDSFFVTENFKLWARDLDPENEFHYVGHSVSQSNTQPLFNLGAGHGVSRKTLKAIAPYLPDTKGSPIPDDKRCARTVTWAEDVEFRNCLMHVGNAINEPKLWIPTETRDRHGRYRFMAFPPNDNIVTVKRPDSTGWFWKGKGPNPRSGVQCCAAHPVGFHGFKVNEGARVRELLHGLDYLMYHVAVDPSPGTILDDTLPEVWTPPGDAGSGDSSSSSSS